MADGIVGWHFFDVESGNVPEECSPSILPGGGRGRIVALAATPFARSKDWAGRAAVYIAKGWAEEGLRIFLMDLGLESPSLHDLLGLPNEEGVSDAFLYGASVQRIAQPALDGAVFFASAGTVAGDPEEVLGHPRWNDLAGGFSEADATLLLFLPTEITGAEKILSRATDIVFLAAQGESPDEFLGPASIKVLAIAGPLGSPPPAEEEAALAKPEPAKGPEPELFGAGLDLAGGFGEVAVGGEEEMPAFTLDGSFELASGFGLETSEDASALGEAPSGGPGAPEPEAEPAPEGGGGFGGDLVMGAAVAGSLELEPVEGGAPSGAPDFGAQFVEFPPLEDGPGSVEGGGGSEWALVQGPDFGAPAPIRAPGDDPALAGDHALKTGGSEGVPRRPSREARLKEAARTPPKRRSAPRKPFPFVGVGLIVVLVGLLGVVAGTALGFLNVPGLTFLQDFFGEIPDPPLTLAGPQPTDEVLRLSLVLFDYKEQELTDAAAMLDALRNRLPQVLFILVPEEVGGDLQYALLAGPASDRIEVEDLRGPLAEVLSREAPASWTVRETPRAFHLGRGETLAQARELLSSAEARGIRAYVLQVTLPDGSEAYEVLAGAYQGVSDARRMQLILRDSGFRDVPLIERRGRLPE